MAWFEEAARSCTVPEPLVAVVVRVSGSVFTHTGHWAMAGMPLPLRFQKRRRGERSREDRLPGLLCPTRQRNRLSRFLSA